MSPHIARKPYLGFRPLRGLCVDVSTGVAEPAALLALPGGRLILKKVKSGNVTLAIAEQT